MDEAHDVTSKLWKSIETCSKNPDTQIKIISELLHRAGILKKNFDDIMTNFFREGSINNIVSYLCGWHLRSCHMCLTGPTVDKCDIVDIEDDNGKTYSMKELDILLTVAVCSKANRYLSLEHTETPGVFSIQVQHATEWPKSLIKCLMMKNSDSSILYLLPVKLVDYIEHLLVENFNKERVSVQPRSKDSSSLVFKIEVDNYKYILLNVTPCIETDILTRNLDRIPQISPLQKSSLFSVPLKLVMVTDVTCEASYRVAERNLMLFMKEDDRHLLRKLRYFNELNCCQNKLLSFDNFKHCLWHSMNATTNWTSLDNATKMKLTLERMKLYVQDGYLPNLFSGVCNLLRVYNKEELTMGLTKLAEACQNVNNILHLKSSDLLSCSLPARQCIESDCVQFICLYQRDRQLNEVSNSLKKTLEIGAELKIFENQASPLTCLKRAIICNQINETRSLALHVDHECLLLAAERGYYDVIKILISQQAAVRALEREDEQPEKETTLHCAARGGHSEIIQLLLEMNLNPDPQHPRLGTPLSQAAAAGYLEACKVLLKYGASPDAVAFGQQKMSLLSVACRDGQLNLVKLLLKYNAHVDKGLHLAAKNGHENCVKEILASGVSPNILDKHGMTALHRAAEKGHASVAQKLLLHGAKLEQARESDGMRPLVCAVKKNQRHMVEFLLSKGATTRGEPNPLLLAATFGYTNVCETLLQHGSNPNYQRSHDARSALHLAAAGGHLTTAVALLRWPVKANACDREGLTAKQLVAPDKKDLFNLISSAEHEEALAQQAAAADRVLALNKFKSAVKVVQYVRRCSIKMDNKK